MYFAMLMHGEESINALYLFVLMVAQLRVMASQSGQPIERRLGLQARLLKENGAKFRAAHAAACRGK